MKAVARRIVAADDLAGWTTPWDAFVRETAEPDGSFSCAEGPFRRYRRRVTVEPIAGSDDLAVTSDVDFDLAIPFWGALFALPVRAALRTPGGKLPWWGPPVRMDARSTSVLATLCVAAMVAGFLGTTITQTLTYVADGFGVVGDRPQSVALAIVRVSIAISLVVAGLADRRGRRKLLVLSASMSCAVAVLCAAAPSLAVFTGLQIVLRGFSAATAVIVTVVAAEEVPAGARAFSVSVLGMAAALGAGICVLCLPLADRGDDGWRLIYLVPVAAVPLLVRVARLLPESRRFERPHGAAALAGHGARLRLLAASTFLVQLFLAPASQLQNEFLRDERGYSAIGITLFTVLTTTPSGIGIVVGGKLADLRGRRGVAAVGLIGGVTGTVLMYLSSGWAMWVWSLLGGVVAAATLPALGVYGPELFPTGVRTRANATLTLTAVIGSATGLLVAGTLSDSLGGLGRALAVLAVGPMILAVLVVTRYPETSGVELEELNPEDRVGPTTTPPRR